MAIEKVRVVRSGISDRERHTITPSLSLIHLLISTSVSVRSTSCGAVAFRVANLALSSLWMGGFGVRNVKILYARPMLVRA